MKYILISDIHNNLKKFSAFIEKIKMYNSYKLVCLGDVSNDEAGPIIEELFSRKAICVKGNCDLSSRLPYGPIIFDKKYAAVHISAVDRSNDLNYISDTEREFKYLIQNNLKALFFGHTHIPTVYSLSKEKSGEYTVNRLKFGSNPIKLDKNSLYLINPGSLSKPRDGTLSGRFAIFDDEEYTVLFIRI